MKLTAVDVYCSGQPGMNATALLHNVQAFSLRQWEAAKHGALTGVRPRQPIFPLWLGIRVSECQRAPVFLNLSA